ncbi:MAG: hypothetical protein P4L42_03100 [Desulfocapsaceae bacterium]|nr:hypothetical protein [Desulfocapsaceae bacterium]
MDVTNWNIESLRLTGFVDNEFEPKNLEKWLTEIGGEQPIQINKTLSNFSGLSKLEQSMLRLDWQQNRIDLIENAVAPDVKNNIGNFSGFSEYCNNHILKYFEMEGSPLLDRLAFGVLLYLPISSNEEGISKITPLLKSVQGIENSEDFLFRVNRPIILDIADKIKINRLLTWTIGFMQLFRINIQPGIPQNIPIVPPPELQIRLEMDFSTVQNIAIKMSIDQQKEVLNHFIATVNKVAELGEYGL